MATSSIASEVQKRGPGRPRKIDDADLNMLGDFAADFFPRLHASFGIRFPSPIYQADPARFSREILGVKPWLKQVEILESVRDYARTAAKSGHKVGKSHTAAQVALWFYCSYDHARVICTSTTSRQVDEILWREIRMVLAKSGRCVACKAELRADPTARIPRPCPHSSLIDGELGELARTGFKSDDFREIVGFTAKQSEAVAGISGENVLYICDEASGIPPMIYEAIHGNRAGSAKLLLLGNPTKNEGEFYDAFNSKNKLYNGITVSSEETPNAVSGERLIPGLATREWIEEMREDWGEKSPLYTVRVRGEFAEFEEGKIFPLHEIGEAEERWHSTAAEGRLYIGLDPAGEKGAGDEIMYALRRGLKHLGFVAKRGLDEDGHLAELRRIIEEHRVPRETPVVVVDREGDIGTKVARKLREHAEDNPLEFELVTVRASDKSMRQPELYPRMRDALAASLVGWFGKGGAIVTDPKLAKELHVLEWKLNVSGQAKVTDKITLKKLLGRSPDRYDALALSAWEPLALREGPPVGTAISIAARLAAAAAPLDPYAAAAKWRR